ncbi:MAG: HlyD family efflux transporter periplasmic adaptor subunit [Minisyncoccia bacterium]|jgi:multidrug efflux pump subunit AcrA (membrane-fusion protein)
MFKKLRERIYAHKVISAIVVILVVGGAYYWYSSSRGTVTVTKYVIENAAQGTVVSSVTGSGQVQAVTSIDIKPQVSENVTKVYVGVGDHVTAGQLLVQLDTTNEQKAVNQAQLSLQSAELSLAELQQISTTTLLQDQSAVIKGQQSALDASTTLVSDYENGFDTLSSVFVNLQSVITDVGNFATGNNINKNQQNADAYVSIMPTYLQVSAQSYGDAVAPSYSAALAAYQQNLADYHTATRSSDRTTLDALFSETYHTTQLVSASVKTINDFLNYIVNNYPKDNRLAPLPTITTTFQTTFGNDISTVNNNVSSVENVIVGIANDKDTLENNQLSLEQASETLAELVAGPTQLNLLSQQISIQSAQNALATAEQNLAYCSIRAPIGGVISATPAVVGTTVPSPAVSMVTQGDLAEVTLNEVDAAKVALGNKATLTFDALPDLSLAGTVSEIDAVGTVSQGVVNYNVQVAFTEASGTTQVRPGMSVTADIVTQVRENVIAVPNAAVTAQGTTSYVSEPATPVSSSTLAASISGGVELPAVKRVPVTTGLSDDTLTEITSGVNEGDQIIVQTLQTTAASAAASTGGTSVLRSLGGGLLGGGGARITTGGGAAGGTTGR